MLVYCVLLLRRKIIRNTEPIVAAVEKLSDGKAISLHVDGELAEIAESVNKASNILSKQMRREPTGLAVFLMIFAHRFP